MNGHRKLDDYWQYWAVLSLLSLLATLYGFIAVHIYLFGWLSFIVFCLGLINLVRLARR